MCGSPAMLSISAAVSRDLPMPGSPEISTTRPSPALACRQRRKSRSSSSSRPTSGVACVRSASKRLTIAAFAEHPPSRCGSAKPGKRLRSKIVDLEQTADLPSRAFGDDERVRRGQGLQPCGEVRGLADDPALLRGALADQVADDDEAAGDAEPHARAGRDRFSRRGPRR